MDKLIQMTDFVLQRNEINGEDYYGYEKTAVECINYAKFLKQPLTLGMFVPCDNDGNPYDLEEFFAWKIHKDYSRFHKEELVFFEDAKEKVLFSCFSVVKCNDIGRTDEVHLLRNDGLQIWGDVYGNKLKMRYPKIFAKTVEELINDYKPLELTESALKQIQS